MKVLGVLVVAFTAVGFSVADATSTDSGALNASEVTTLVFSTGAIPGGGSPAGHGANSIDVYGWHWGISGTASSAGHGGHVKMGSIIVTKSIDRASPVLFRACATGQHLGTATIYFDEPAAGGTAGGYTTYMTITLSNVWVSADSLDGVTTLAGEELPKESLTLNFTSAVITSTPPGGVSTTYSWKGVIG